MTCLSRAQMQLLMMGHAYPMLRGSTHATFCTVTKPQPMYVPQAVNRKLSMYSNWRVTRFNPNPLGLSSKELMALYQQHRYGVRACVCVCEREREREGEGVCVCV